MGRIELEWDDSEGPGLPEWVVRALEGSSDLDELRRHIDRLRHHIDNRFNALIALEAISMGQFEDLKDGVAAVSAAAAQHAQSLNAAIDRVEAKIAELGQPDPDLTAELASLRDVAGSLDSQTTELEQLAVSTPAPEPTPEPTPEPAPEPPADGTGAPTP